MIDRLHSFLWLEGRGKLNFGNTTTMLSSYTVFVRIYAQIANTQAAFTLCFAEQKLTEWAI